MKNSNPKPPKAPLTREQKLTAAKVCLIFFLVAAFTIANAITLVRNFKFHDENTELVETARAYQAQADYAKESQLVTEFLPELSPPLIRFQDDGGSEHLYYCLRVNVDNLLNDPKKDNYWFVTDSDRDFDSRTVDLPSYNEAPEQVYYHAYEYEHYDGEIEYKLETCQIHQLDDNSYYKIECTYTRLPSSIDINDSDAVSYYILQQDPPNFVLNSIPLPHPNSTQIENITNDNNNIIRLDPPKKSCNCGCTGCTCTDCKCTG